MRIAVCIPWHDSGDAHRRAAFDYCHRWWAQNIDGEIYWGNAGEPFNIAASRNMLADRAVDAHAEILVFADADTVPQHRPQIIDAAHQALLAPGVIYPHDHYWSLTAWDTTMILGGATPDPTYFANPNRVSVSGVLVCTSTSWEAAGRWDERFTGWGNEDVAFSLMARDVLGRALRTPGHVFHLWHPRDVGYPTIQPNEDQELIAAYRWAAEQGPHALRALRLDALP